jgi:hypothetical protein
MATYPTLPSTTANVKKVMGTRPECNALCWCVVLCNLGALRCGYSTVVVFISQSQGKVGIDCQISDLCLLSSQETTVRVFEGSDWADSSRLMFDEQYKVDVLMVDCYCCSCKHANMY